ncbi:NUC173 domain-containing protein [Dipodascopsis tothii]|uniref:NUC173 domain-containing protein n=1 Tax=Dipodascopsis tothii TaxID=44089 RepID=UPI0034CFF2CB
MDQDKTRPSEAAEGETVDGLTLETKLGRLRPLKTSNLAHQRQVAVMLQAVEETLSEQGTELKASAYFIAILSMLGQAFSGQQQNHEMAATVLYLLDIVLPYTPEGLLRSKFKPILECISPVLNPTDAPAGLIRSGIGCLESLLAAQDSGSWGTPSTELGSRSSLLALLSLGLNESPKVRKRAQDAITGVLSRPPPGPGVYHPAAELCADIALKSARDLYADSINKFRKGGDKAADKSRDKRVFFALQLVKAVAQAEASWPVSRVEPFCETMFEISRSTDEHLIVSTFDVFQTAFAGMARGDADAGSLDAGRFVSFIDSIVERCPATTDRQLAPPWLAIVAQAMELYSKIDQAKAFQRLPKLFPTISTFLETSAAPEIATSAAQCMVALVSTCMPEELLVQTPLPKATRAVIKEVVGHAMSFLGVRYQSTRKDTFAIIAALFDQLNALADPYLLDAVVAVEELRSTKSFEGRDDADDVLAAAIRALGPDKVLRLIPLNLEQQSAKSPGRAWLLPLLRDNIQVASLAHFTAEFVPLSERLHQKVAGAGAQEKTVETKIYETLVEQIWSLLPKYCDLPTDLRKGFDDTFAEMLGSILYQQVELRPVVCKSLRLLIESNQIYLSGDLDSNLFLQQRLSKKEARKNVEYLAAFAPKFLAVLFNVFSQTLAEYRNYILDCIGAFLSITTEADVAATFDKVKGLLLPALADTAAKKEAPGKKTVPVMSHTMMDLAIAMIPHLSAAQYADLSTIFAQATAHADPQIQKRGYRVVIRLAETEAGRDFILSHLATLETTILAQAEAVGSPARGSLLNALAAIVEMLPSSDLHFIPSVLSLAIISTKEVNEKTRDAAYDLLVQMGDKMCGGGTITMSKVANMDPAAADSEASIEEYFTMVSAGLAGVQPHMISASITALSRLLYQYKNVLDRSVIEALVETIDLFLTSKNREIVKAALGFVKVMVTSLPKDLVEPRLATLVPNLLNWAHEHNARFKMKIKNLIERMTRRFGFEAMESVFPENDLKLLTNIRKSSERERRKQDAAAAGPGEAAPAAPQKKFLSEYERAIYDSDDDSDDEAAADDKPKKKGRGRAETFIVNNADDEPLDLLDRKSLANISSARPKKAATGAAKSKAAKMQINDDGKMVINDDDAKKPADTDAEMLDEMAKKAADGTSINAYVEAVQNGPVRGQRNKLKYKKRRARDDDDSGDEAPRKPRRARL